MRAALLQIASREAEHGSVIAWFLVKWESQLHAQRAKRRDPARAHPNGPAELTPTYALGRSKGLTNVKKGYAAQPVLLRDWKQQFNIHNGLFIPTDNVTVLFGT